MNKILGIVKKSSLLKSGFWYTCANFFLKGVNFISIPVFVQMMSVKDYGFINNFTAWTLIVTYFVGMNLNVAVNNANFEFKKNIDAFMSSVLFLGIIIGMALTVLTMIAFSLWPKFFGLSKIVVFCVLLQSFSMFVVTFQSAFYMINNKYFQNIILSFFSTVANFGVSLFFMFTIYSSNVALGRVYGSTFGLALLALYLCFRILLRGRNIVNVEYWLYALKISIPVIPHSLGNILLSQFDRIMITNTVGNNAAGIYSYAYNISTVINVLWLSMNNAWIPWFYSKMKAMQYEIIRKVMGDYIRLFSFLSVIAINMLIDVGRLMGQSTYIVGIKLIVPISLGYFFIFLYGFAVNTEFFYKKTVFIGAITSMSAALNVLLNLYFIPKYGYVSAAYTTLVTFVFQFCTHAFMGYKIEKKLAFHIYDYKALLDAIISIGVYAVLLLLFLKFLFVRYIIMLAFITIIILPWFSRRSKTV